MSQTVSGYSRKLKWYNRQIFPLVPLLEIKSSDEHNTKGFTFRWLIFTIWTIDSFCFEFAFTADTHWGIGFKGLFPYIRWVIAIPCPENIGIWIDGKLSRGR